MLESPYHPDTPSSSGDLLHSKYTSYHRLAQLRPLDPCAKAGFDPSLGSTFLASGESLLHQGHGSSDSQQCHGTCAARQVGLEGPRAAAT